MAQEEVTIQTADEVGTIDYMRKTTNIVNAQTEEMKNNMDAVSEKLDVILNNTATTISTSNAPDIDLSEVTSLIEDIDTTVVESNTQDILVKINQQQKQIDNIEEKINLILSKL